MSSAPRAVLLSSEVMTDRGGDQLMLQPSRPTLHENWVCDHTLHRHPGIEMYQQHAIFYVSGDLLNDFQGITAPKSIGSLPYQQDLTARYPALFQPLYHTITRLVLTPLKIRKFQLLYPSAAKGRWLRDRVAQVSRVLSSVVPDFAERFVCSTLPLDKESTEIRSTDMESTDMESTVTESTVTESTETESIRDAL